MRRFKFRGLAIGKGEPFIFSPTTVGEGSGTTNRETTQYFNTDGETIGAQAYEARTVTIDGHILADNPTEMAARRLQLIRACDGKSIGNLEYWNGVQTYHAQAVCDIPLFGQMKANKAPYGLEFSLTFRLPGFYWYGKEKTIPVVERRNLIYGDFTLPTIFTERTMERIVVNDGMADTPLRIIGVVYGNVDTVTISNKDTGQSIEIVKPLENGDVLTIDTEQLTVKTEMLGNIINHVTADSDIDMTIPVGSSTIKGEYTGSGSIALDVTWESRFVGV